MGTRFKRAREHYSAPEYDISTREIQEYLQGKLDVVVSVLKQEKRYDNLDDIKISVGAAKASDTFVPLIVTLPKEALESEASNMDNEIPSIWTKTEENEEVRMIEDLEDFFRMYTFKKDDIKMLKNREYQRKQHIRPSYAASVVGMCRPTYHVFKKGSEYVDARIMFALDPVRVFMDMLCEENEKQGDVDITITGIKKIRNSQYEFRVVKRRQKNKGNNNDAYEKDIETIFSRLS